jgi:hypothetical protein
MGISSVPDIPILCYSILLYRRFCRASRSDDPCRECRAGRPDCVAVFPAGQKNAVVVVPVVRAAQVVQPAVVVWVAPVVLAVDYSRYLYSQSVSASDTRVAALPVLQAAVAVAGMTVPGGRQVS